MSKAMKEIKFIVQIVKSLGIKVLKPIIVVENASGTKHTRHIDAHHHFVREYIIDGHIKIIFVMSTQNKADMFTKNVNSEIYEEHMDDFIIHENKLN
jgi:hypothetical protein